MSGHTPGPWEANYSEFDIYAGGKLLASAATVEGCECEANLNLIASAPELLAALKLLVDEAQWLGWDCSHITPVINKAEGRGEE
jgi:hypothetical protein